MKVLILSQHFWPETFRINEVAQSLREAGCEVTVLTGKPNYPDGAVFAGYRAWGTSRSERDGITVLRVPLMPRGRGGALRLVANYLSYIACASLFGPWLLRGRDFDVMLVYGTSPILQAIPGVVLRRLRRRPLVTWVQDLWPESLEATGFVRHPALLRAVGRVVRWIYRRNDLLLVQSHAFESAVAPLAGTTPMRYHPNPGERAFDAASSGACTAPALQLPDGFNLVFAGNLGTAQALDTVIEAAALLRDTPAVRLVLVGSGARLPWLRQQVRERGLDNVMLPGRFAPEAMPGILSQASALLVSLVRSPIMSLTVPSKVQAYLAAGCPIVASLDGEGARVVEASGAGVACAAEDARALAEAVRRLAARPEAERRAMGEAGRCYYRQHFDPALLAAQLVDHLRSARLQQPGQQATAPSRMPHP